VSPLEKLRALLGQRVADHPVVVNVPSYRLPQIAQSGELYNMFEGVPSTGFNDLPGRRAAEHRLLGIPEDAPASRRPVYGYLGDESSVANPLLADIHGDARLIMRPSVKDRSTFSLYDTMGESSPVGAPRAFSLGLSDEELERMIPRASRSVYPDPGFNERPWPEPVENVWDGVRRLNSLSGELGDPERRAQLFDLSRSLGSVPFMATDDAMRKRYMDVRQSWETSRDLSGLGDTIERMLKNSAPQAIPDDVSLANVSDPYFEVQMQRPVSVDDVAAVVGGELPGVPSYPSSHIRRGRVSRDSPLRQLGIYAEGGRVQ
jgi:hypothetical protein